MPQEVLKAVESRFQPGSEIKTSKAKRSNSNRKASSRGAVMIVAADSEILRTRIPDKVSILLGRMVFQ